MKNFFYSLQAKVVANTVAVVCLISALSLAAVTAQAGNDYLNKFEHYSVMSMGDNVLRFKIPVWVHSGGGSDRSYYLAPEWENFVMTYKEGNKDLVSIDYRNYVYYKTTDNQEGMIALFGSAELDNNAGFNNDGCGYAYLWSRTGTCVVVNTWDGTPLEIIENDSTHYPPSFETFLDGIRACPSDREYGATGQIAVTRMNTSYVKNVVYLEFDWIIPEALAEKSFHVGLHAFKHQVDGTHNAEEYNWMWDNIFSGINPQDPQLFDPYFYGMSMSGTKTIGKAAMQYMTYQDPKSYHTSLNPQTEIRAEERSGTVLVDMQDTVQTVNATFTVWLNKAAAPTTTTPLTTNRMDIPAYHKIHNFRATELMDEQGSVTGDVQLNWNTEYPQARDIIPGDVFEIQRATKEDFSDAVSIGMEVLSNTQSDYSLSDESENVRLVLREDSVYQDLGRVATSTQIPIYVDSTRMGSVTATITSNISSAGSTLHYRIRRGSAAVWDWAESDWMQTTSLVKHDYLAPLKDEALTYTLDPEFEENRKVHFSFNLDNVAVTNNLDPIETLGMKYSTGDISNELPIEVQYTVERSSSNINLNAYYITFYQEWGNRRDTLPLTTVIEDSRHVVYKTFAHNGTPVRYSIIPKSIPMTPSGFRDGGTGSFDPLNNVSILLERSFDYTSFGYVTKVAKVVKEPIDVMAVLMSYLNLSDAEKDSVKAVLYEQLKNQINETQYGRCSWDRNARLYLIRRYVETGEELEILIPNDSVKRLEDGSWGVHFVNEASRSCVHYQYAVRLDQTLSTLKVQNPSTQLRPKPVTGADLYRNQVAEIAAFTAEGDKKGILLQWQPNAGSLDEYTLFRREKGSSADFDSITTQTIEGYYDVEVEPGVNYEYRVDARYTCQGTTTVNSATTEGTRLAFGSIAGRVQYEDGTGCYGIEVVLSAEGKDDISTYTNETGAFLFDSLYYVPQTTYSVTPVSQSATFHYNNTSSPTASVTLNKNNCEVQQLYFDNISAVRLSGRVLYKNSTVPIRDANILLNGKLVKQSGEAYKTDVSGNFQINVPYQSEFTIRIVKEGHEFENDGYVLIDGEPGITLDKSLDGVRVWDRTKVRLAGRVVGGQDQAALPLGHGLSKNNIGENLQLVLELEGDNISWLVRDPEDLTKDTLEFTVRHDVYSTGSAAPDSVGVTKVHYQKKRIIIDVDPVTGEYEADLFPTKYKVIQATARGYATLFAQGKTGETVDLSNAVTQSDTVVYNGKYAVSNAQFCITYRAPIVVTYKQYRYGLEYDYYGDRTHLTYNLAGQDVRIDLARQDSATGEWEYLFGAPVFAAGLYQFRVSAHEDYYYNNDRANKPDVVNLKGGNLKVYNGMQETTGIKQYPLDNNGSALVDIVADHVTYVQDGDMALRTLDFSVESDGDYIEAEPLRAYILGAVEKNMNYLELDTVSSGVTLLDVLRDPPGSASYATLEKGTTYQVKYKTFTNYRFGLELQFSVGNNNEYFIGTYAGTPAAGTEAGVVNVVHKSSEWKYPVSWQYHKEEENTYEVTTNERISTSTDPYNVGSMADVYIGVTNGVVTGKSLAFRVVDSLSYEMLAAQRANGNAVVITQGTDENGAPWYLMRTEDILLKHGITSSFAYTQEHIFNTIIPNLFDYRDGLLITGTKEEAQAAADKNGKYIFWSHVAPNDTAFGMEGSYEIVKATGYTGATVNKVNAANVAILNWLHVISQNEQVKINSYYTTPFHQISISGGVTQTYNEDYAYSSDIYLYTGNTFHLTPFPDRQSGKWQSDGIGGFWLTFGKEIVYDKWFKGRTYSQKMTELLANTYNVVDEDDYSTTKPSDYIKVNAGQTEFNFKADPIIDFGSELIPQNHLVTGGSKAQSFTLAPNANEHLTLQVFKSYMEGNNFNDEAEYSREFASENGQDPDAVKFGSLVYRTIGGATVCPWEGADSTLVYYPGTPMNSATLKIENPQIVIDKHELSNIPHDGEGYFTIQMWNEIEESEGLAAGSQGIKFNLKLDENTNPKGLEIIIDGMPLTDGREFRFFGSNVITKTVKVRAAKDYDYEDICLKLESQCTSTLTYNKACFSVHFTPVSCPVHISTPSDKWIMNTLSSKDEQGYYIPVSIDGFDTNYDNFDHIELQYKLVTQPNDAWVNLCSYYAVDSLYQLASGTKRMIENGKIENFRFYGERDPMEQQYNLRAVSFCRHGSGFITRSSEVLTGTKDTRVPRVFGDPEPVDAVLGVGDYLKLRFNEPIAGNYLDEDNNFQLTGYTNESGITTESSVHFHGVFDSYAKTKVARSISNKSFSIDMLVKPETTGFSDNFFTYQISEDKLFTFGKTSDNRLIVTISDLGIIMSDPLPEPMTAFTRVVVTYNYDDKKFRFFAGTKEVTDSLAPAMPSDLSYSTNSPFILGQGFLGNMLEVRLWTKALSVDEIANTHLRRLTGYERELLAYYPMNEGQGETLADKANGATLYMQGADWDHKKDISLRVPAGKRVKLDGNLMSRSAAQDMTLMFWFKTGTAQGTIYSAGAIDNKHGSELAFVDGVLTLRNDSSSWPITSNLADNEWHHAVLTISRTFNNAAVFIDDVQHLEAPTTRLSAISGDMYFGGNGFNGYIDDYAIFEQALPKSIVESYGTTSPYGDEMGLMAYLPFSEMKENSSGIYEQVFSINDQRQFKTTDGQVVKKVVPLVLEVSDGSDIADLADKNDHAPVQTSGMLTKMNFDWSFNQDELLINLKMLDREINKQEIYVTVRDVEDLNGNPMASPVTWSAFVDRNALKWSRQAINHEEDYGDVMSDWSCWNVSIINNSGKRHQYTIESVPDWIVLEETFGSIQPLEEKELIICFDPEHPVGTYSDVIYLTDENGLSEPLRVEMTIVAKPPYKDIEKNKYPYNMSICGQVKLKSKDGTIAYDTDPNDIVYALYHNECVGMAKIDFDNQTNKSKVFLTVYGNDDMVRKSLSFQLWQASTGKVINLSADHNMLFAHGYVYGCDEGQPVQFTAGNSEVQNITLEPGWNWTSLNINVNADETGLINNVMIASEPWSEGDLIKNPATRMFSTYYGAQDRFVGTLAHFRYTDMYMIYTNNGNTIRIAGDELPADSMRITLRGDGQWNSFPCLFSQSTSITEALADYYDKASAGDLIKAHDRFAYFSADQKWEGNLAAVRPGEGYLFRRMGAGTVSIRFFDQKAGNGAPKRAKAGNNIPADIAWSNPAAASNMTMIAMLPESVTDHRQLMAYIGDELVGVSEPIAIGDSFYYFLTIQSDKIGNLRFRTEDGQWLTAEGQTLNYEADAHHGSLRSPVILKPLDEQLPYKIIENNHVIIIRNNEKYDVTGKKL